MNTAVEQNQVIDTRSRNQKHQIGRIASYLMQALHIPNGNHLILFFGTGHEVNNRQALIHWIEIHLDEINPDDAEIRLKELAIKAVNNSKEQLCND